MFHRASLAFQYTLPVEVLIPVSLIILRLSALPSMRAGCDSAHAAPQYISSMSHVLQASRIMSASLLDTCMPPGSSYDPVERSAVLHAADTAVLPHAVVSLQRSWRHRGRY